MATPFREWPWPGQAVVYLIVGVVLVLVGLYVPYSPVESERVAVDNANAQLKPLEAEVQTLRVYQQRRVELQNEMQALQKQLATLQAIVPENKEVSDFMVMVQRAASASGVFIRKLVSQPIVAKQYHYEMPFEITADGPYFSMLDFFARLGRLSRIINVGDLKLTEVRPGQGSTQFRMAPGTTVSGAFVVTTFISSPSGAGATPTGGTPAARPAARAPMRD